MKTTRLVSIPPILYLLIFSVAAVAQDVRQRIERVENGLELALQIEGEKNEFFNLEERMQALNVPGLSIAVVKDGRIDWAKGYGYADVARMQRVDTETLFQAASISKTILAIRLLQLVESGAIDLDTDVNQYLISWKVPNNEFTQVEKVTLRRILNHTAGLTVWGFPERPRDEAEVSIVDTLEGNGIYEPVTVFQPPGSGWLYSGGGYLIGQLLISELDGKPAAESITANVLQPLGMTRSTFGNELPRTLLPSAATGYREDGTPVDGRWYHYPSGLWSTPSDLARIATAIQSVHQEGGNGILGVNYVDLMLTASGRDYGLGFQIDEVGFSHGGANEGYRSIVYGWKDQPYAVAIMLNSKNGVIMQEILISVAKAYSLPGVQPDIRKTVRLTEDELNSFAGRYQADGRGPVSIELSDGRLRLTASFISDPIDLFPQSGHTLFDRSGTTYRFDSDEISDDGFLLDDGRFFESID